LGNIQRKKFIKPEEFRGGLSACPKKIKERENPERKEFCGPRPIGPSFRTIESGKIPIA